MARRRNELERLYGDGSDLRTMAKDDPRRKDKNDIRSKPEADDDMARLMPETTINPEVGSELVDLSLLDATRNFGKKIWRVIKLRDITAYNLPKKKKEGGDEKTKKLVEELSKEEAEARKNMRTIHNLASTLENFPAKIESLQKTYKINKNRIGELHQKVKEIRSAVANLDEQVSDFTQAERIPDLEAELAQETGWRKAYKGARLVDSKSLYDQASDERYQRAYQSQAEIEEKISELEASIKREKNVDLTSFPVDENLNAQTPYDPARLSRSDFEARQQRLVDRLKACMEVQGEFATGKDELTQKKKAFSKKKKKSRRAAKAVKAFESGRRYKLERLLWYEFGDQIALIRAWQARLPKMSRLGQDAYMSHVTVINRDYEGLRAEIARFETDNSISGLAELLDFELGIKRPLELTLVPAAPAGPAAQASPAVPELLSPQRRNLIDIVNSHLAYRDIYDQLPDEQRRRMDKNLAHREETGNLSRAEEEYGTELQLILQDPRRQQLLAPTCLAMKQEVIDLLLTIGAEPMHISPWTKSSTWAIWDIAKQSYLQSHAGESSTEDRPADPFEDNQLRQEMVDRQFGWELILLYSNILRDQIQAWIDRSSDNTENQKILEILNRGGHIASWEYARVGAFFRKLINEKKNLGSGIGSSPSAPPNLPSPPTQVIEATAEVIELPLSDEQVKNTSLDLQKKIVQRNLTKIFGLDSTQATIVWDVLGDLETTFPHKFEKYVGLICTFADVLEFLFRLTYKDNPVQLPDKTLKALPAKPRSRQDLGSSKILDVLDHPQALHSLAGMMRSGRVEEAIGAINTAKKSIQLVQVAQIAPEHVSAS